jgi:putative NADH-flavin reductase
MVRITVVGGTGYAGRAIVAEAATRGHNVVSFSRNLPDADARIPGVNYETGSVLDSATLERVMENTDVVVSALSPRGELDGRIVEVDRNLAEFAGQRGVRIGVVGGFSSLRLEEGGPRMAEGDDIPPAFISEAKQMNTVLSGLIDSNESVDWFFVSPAQQFGSYAPGESLGHYRVGGDVAFYDEAGVSAISGADFARAIVDEIENSAHHRVQISVAY